jgi:hypothetical protein
MRNRDFGNAMEERPHPPAPSPVKGEGGQETTLSNSDYLQDNSWGSL